MPIFLLWPVLRSMRGCRLFLSMCLQSTSLLRGEWRGIISLCRYLLTFLLNHEQFGLLSYSYFSSALKSSPLPAFRFASVLKFEGLPADPRQYLYSFGQAYIVLIGRKREALQIVFFEVRIPLPYGSKTMRLLEHPKKFQTLHYWDKKTDLLNLWQLGTYGT